MSSKTYVLLEHTKPTAPIFQRVSKDQRVRLDKRPLDHAYLKQTFTTPEGRNRTARLKLSCDTIWQDEQIKPEVGIPANEPFTQSERDAVKFVFGVLVTKNEIVQKYLESVPQFEGWWAKDKIGKGIAEDKPLYMFFDKENEARVTLDDTRKRIKAAAKVLEIESVQEGQDLMIRLNGTAFKAPDDLVEIQNQLISFVEDADETMLDAILKEEKEISIDEKTTILIGRAITQEVISFDQVPNQVAKKDGNGKWVGVKEISSSHDIEERKRYFAEFITSEDGKLLRNDLEKAVKKAGVTDKTK